jgi:hypothetical protein
MCIRNVCAFLAGVTLCGPLSAAPCPPVRRALVVGISLYSGKNRPAAIKTAQPVVARIPVTGSTLRAKGLFEDLPGAVNDAKEIADVLQGYEFKPSNIRLLLNEEATAQNILDSFQNLLIPEASCPGDVSLFYYSGHGSQIKNTAKVKAGDLDPYDRTLVPYDAADGVPDVRSLELIRLYKKAVDQGIFLTVILDSCQSGGLSRGVTFAKTRAIGEDPRTVEDSGLRDQTGSALDLTMLKNTTDAEKHPPVLFLSAATEKDPANEHNGHGDFTHSLVEKLREHADKAAIGDVFSDVRASVVAFGDGQRPQITGEGRLNKDLFGGPADPLSGMIVRSTSPLKFDKTIQLDRGRTAGLYENCELVGATPDTKNVRLQITKANGATSVATMISDSGDTPIGEGFRFRLDKWVVPEGERLHVFFERSGMPAATLKSAADVLPALEAMGFTVVSDSTAEASGITPPQIWWVAGSWRLYQGRADVGVDLGKTLHAAAIRKQLNPGRIFVSFPLAAESAAKIELGEGTRNDAVDMTPPLNGATPDYILAGRWNREQQRFEYAWLQPGRTEKDQPKMQMPLRTDWMQGGEKDFELDVQTRALKLNRIYSWVHLPDPPGGGDPGAPFPYRMELRKVGTNQVLKQGDQSVKGEQYKVFMRADPDVLTKFSANGGVPSRWIYVIAIDRDGTIGVIAPPGNLNVGNFVPGKGEGSPPPELPITSQTWDFKIAPPLGLDTYIMISANEQIDPRLLRADGVRTRSLSRGGGNPLSDLLTNIGASGRTRGAATPVPTDWSVQPLTIPSVEK